MKKIFYFVIGLISFNSLAQNTESKLKITQVEINKPLTFEEFVETNSISFLESNGKGLKDIGEITISSFENLKLSTLNITAKEDKAQYFYVNNSNKIMKVESLYRSRLIYQTKK